MCSGPTHRFLDQSEWLECVCVLENVGDELRSRLIAEKKLTSVGVASLARQVIHGNLKKGLGGKPSCFCVMEAQV
jgi:hypothetical protein